MRIAIFSDNFYPELSGISDTILATGKELAERGHKIIFYVPKYSENDYKKIGAAKKELDLGENIKIVRLASFGFKTGSGQGRGVIPAGFRWLSLKKFDPDIIHTHLFFGAGIEALITAKILKKPLVGTNHTAIKEFTHYAPIKGAWFTKLILKYVNWYYGKCDIMSAPSRSVISEMAELGFKGKSVVVSNPISLVFNSFQNKDLPRKKFKFSKRVIIYAGRIAKEKNIDVIIRSLPAIKKEIPEIELVLAGSGPATEELKALCGSLGVEKNVKFLGFVTQPVLAEIYNGCDIFLITSTSDTQSMVMMQAMACGLPIVAVRARGLPEYVNDSNGILVEPNNEKMVAESVVRLFKNQSLIKNLGNGALEFAKQFSTPAIAEKWEKIYAEAIKNYSKKND